MKTKTAIFLISGLALTGLVAGAQPSTAQSPAPQITIQGGPAANAPANAQVQVPPAAKTPAASKSTEVLPWANKPLMPMASVSGEDFAATEAAAAQCSGLFEAACRDLKTCAWVADVALEEGTLVPARCAARPPAPPKKAAKKKAPPKKAAEVSEETGTTTAAPPAPAVKAVVTRVEDEEPAAAPKTAEKKVEQTKTAVTTEPEATEPPPVAEKAPPAEVEKKEPEQAAKKEAPDKADVAPGPVVVKPPTEPTPPKMPSFGSISPIMPGAGDAVVVTVPPSQ